MRVPEKMKGQKKMKEIVHDLDLCTACGACTNLCPHQAAYEDKVVVLHDCDLEKGKCYAFCPRTPTNLKLLRKILFDEEDLTPEIGAVKEFHITRGSDKELRKRAQHGGTVSTIMAMALDEGIIDTAIICDTKPDLLAQGVAATKGSGIKEMGKSSFVVSSAVSEFNRISKGPSKKIGVVATPCQALALAKMRAKPFENDTNNIDKLVFVIGLFCGWALSWDKFCKLLRSKTDVGAITKIDILPSKYQSLEVCMQDRVISIPLKEITPCIRESCHYCFDMTCEFSDVSVGSARLDEGWAEAKQWNHVIVRTKIGQTLIEMAKNKNLIEFRKVPVGNLDRLKMASMGKKRMAVENLSKKSGSLDNLIYIDHNDAMFEKL